MDQKTLICSRFVTKSTWNIAESGFALTSFLVNDHKDVNDVFPKMGPGYKYITTNPAGRPNQTRSAHLPLPRCAVNAADTWHALNSSVRG